MAQVYDTGAVHAYVGLGSTGSALYLGTGERAPKQRILRGWEPVFNDLAGTADPFEELYEGMWAFVMMRLTRWNRPLYDQMQSTPFTLGNPGTPGTDPLGAVGTAMMTENALYPLWLVYDYGAQGRNPKAAMIVGGLPPGRHYFGVKLESPDEETTGTQANSIDIIWKAKRIYNSSTGAFNLWDTNVAGMPAPN